MPPPPIPWENDGPWSCEVRWCRGPDVVPVADNYDRLGYAAGAITREARYTRYVSAGRMLRSHSTALIPPALRQLARDRQEPRVHPYTERGRQVDVRYDGRWAEVWECGPGRPGVLAGAGLAGCGGVALGMGLDRLLMLVKGIPDIRLLRSAGPAEPPRPGRAPRPGQDADERGGQLAA